MTRARLGALLALIVIAGVALGSVPANAQVDRRALVVLVPGASFEELLAIPDVASLARGGGAALLVNVDEIVEFEGTAIPDEVRFVLDPNDPGGLPVLVERIGSPLGSTEAADELLVIVVGADLRNPGDTVGGIVMARGAPDRLFPEEGDAGSLTSDSTRRPGVVTGRDIRATLTDYLGRAPLVSGELTPGEPIQIVGGPPPFDLYERYLAQRRMYIPIGVAAVLYLAGAGLVATAFLVRRRSVPAQWQRVAGWMALSVPMLAVGLLAAGHLPQLSYASAVPMVAIVTVFGTMAFSPLERRELTVVPAGIGAAVIVFFVAEALLGWSGMLTPLVGGAQLDGGRFFGLPNVAIGLLVGATMWVAQRTSTAAGFALTCAVALFAGLPLVGVNLGAAVTLFAAAGFWLAVRERERLGLWMGTAAFVAVTVVGAGVILVSHAISPFPTHVSRFEEDIEGIGEIWDTFLDRLHVGFDLIAGSPLALVPVVGIVAVLFLVLRPPPAIRDTFARWPAWRDANIVIALAGLVAYLANDSGPAAVGFAFGLALGGMLGVPLLVGTRKMEER
ncbi:MAG: hypothetical protein WD965_08115 [Actinomycetota bacterium]